MRQRSTPRRHDMGEGTRTSGTMRTASSLRIHAAAAQVTSCLERPRSSRPGPPRLAGPDAKPRPGPPSLPHFRRTVRSRRSCYLNLRGALVKTGPVPSPMSARARSWLFSHRHGTAHLSCRHRVPTWRVRRNIACARLLVAPPLSSKRAARTTSLASEHPVAVCKLGCFSTLTRSDRPPEPTAAPAALAQPMPDPSTVLDGSDPGDDTQLRYRYQHGYGVILLCGAAIGTLPYVSIWCEHHEDLLGEKPNGQFDSYQVKTATPESSGPWKMSNAQLLKSLGRFLALDQRFPWEVRLAFVRLQRPVLRHRAGRRSSQEPHQVLSRDTVQRRSRGARLRLRESPRRSGGQT